MAIKDEADLLANDIISVSMISIVGSLGSRLLIKFKDGTEVSHDVNGNHRDMKRLDADVEKIISIRKRKEKILKIKSMI